MNINIVSDLLKYFHDYLEKPNISFSNRIQCIQTVIKTLQGPGKILAIDETPYINMLYSILLEATMINNRKDIPSVIHTCYVYIYIYIILLYI